MGRRMPLISSRDATLSILIAPSTSNPTTPATYSSYTITSVSTINSLYAFNSFSATTALSSITNATFPATSSSSAIIPLFDLPLRHYLVLRHHHPNTRFSTLLFCRLGAPLLLFVF